MAHDHDHGRSAGRRALLGALLLTGTVVEVLGGLFTGSLALALVRCGWRGVPPLPSTVLVSDPDRNRHESDTVCKRGENLGATS